LYNSDASGTGDPENPGGFSSSTGKFPGGSGLKTPVFPVKPEIMRAVSPVFSICPVPVAHPCASVIK